MGSLQIITNLSNFINNHPYLLIYVMVIFMCGYGVLWAYGEGLI